MSSVGVRAIADPTMMPRSTETGAPVWIERGSTRTHRAAIAVWSRRGMPLTAM